MPHPEPDTPAARDAWRDTIAAGRRARARRCTEPTEPEGASMTDMSIIASLELTADGRAVFHAADGLDVDDVLGAMAQALEDVRAQMEAGR